MVLEATVTYELHERFESLPVAVLQESKRNTRRNYNESKLAELTESIRSKGVITPLIVRPTAGKTETYEVAAGHRRLRAAIAAGVETVPVIIRNYEDDDFLEVLTIENLQREDVHPMEEAEGYADLLRRPGYDVATLAQKVGKSDAYIYQRIKLLDLAPELRDAFVQDRIQFGHALILARLTPVQQKELVEEELFGDDGDARSVQSLRSIVEQNYYLDLTKARFPILDAGLVQKAGSCDKCEKRTGFNPRLFPEVVKNDHCLDKACFYGKANAFASLQVKRIQKNTGEKPLLLATCNQWGTKQKQPNVIYDDAWREVRKGKECESSRKGVIVDIGRFGHQTLQLGDELLVCTQPRCQTHWRTVYDSPARAAKSERTPAELKAELARQEKEAATAAVDLALVAAAVDAAAYPFSPKILRELARVMWQRLWSDHQHKVRARRGIKRVSGYNQPDELREEIEHMTIPELAGLITEIAIMESGGGRSEKDGPDMLELTLQAIGAPVLEAIEADARGGVKAIFDAKRAKIDKAEAKKAEEAKKVKAEAKTATKDQPAAKAAPAKKGKGKK